jgi:S1-C subfamily serine protease
MIEQVESVARHLVAHTAPSVVAVGRDGRGSGFVVAPERVLTNAHHLRDRTIQVTFADGRVEQGTVAGLDPDGDLVVLAVPTGGVGALEWGEAPSAGTVVFGLSRGGGRPRVTAGLVSAAEVSFRGPRGRLVAGSVEHTAPLARGASGGPLVDAEGRVLAVNTHRVGDGFYLARPADEALRARVADLAGGRSVDTHQLGVAVVSPQVARRLRSAVGLPERDGLLVRGVADGSRGARAGLRAGDLIVSAGGHACTSVDVLHQALASLDPSAPRLELVVVRGVEELTLVADFAREASEPQGAGGTSGGA